MAMGAGRLSGGVLLVAAAGGGSRPLMPGLSDDAAPESAGESGGGPGIDDDGDDRESMGAAVEDAEACWWAWWEWVRVTGSYGSVPRAAARPADDLKGSEDEAEYCDARAAAAAALAWAAPLPGAAATGNTTNRGMTHTASGSTSVGAGVEGIAVGCAEGAEGAKDERWRLCGEPDEEEEDMDR